jgi:2,4-dienoyl-CoA reductase-like NADH-dependent reductase (Old Yellow Enzyme family)
MNMLQPLQLRSLTLSRRLVVSLSIHYNIDEQEAGKRVARLTFLTDIYEQMQANEHIGLVIVQFSADQYEYFWLWHELLQVHSLFHNLLHTHVGLHIPSMYAELLPEQVDETQMRYILAGYDEMAQLADSDSFDMLTLDFTRDSLPFKFIDATSNARRDYYGGNLQERVRFPLKILDTVRQNWPDEKPLAIRLPTVAQDTEDEIIEVARLLQEHGCDLISIAMEPVTEKDAETAHQRQRQLSERIRTEVPIATMMIGNVDQDEVNTCISAGQTDLFMLVEEGRQHAAR